MLSPRQMRAISEIVAALLILLIIISVGVSVYLYMFSRVMSYQQSLSQQLISEEIKTREYLLILYVIGNSTNGRITIILVTGNWPVDLIAVYVNNTLAYDFASSPKRTLPPQNVTELHIPSPIALTPKSIIEVKVIYEGGEEVAFGEVV